MRIIPLILLICLSVQVNAKTYFAGSGSVGNGADIAALQAQQLIQDADIAKKVNHATVGDVVTDYENGTGLKLVIATDTGRFFVNTSGSDITLTGGTEADIASDGLTLFPEESGGNFLGKVTDATGLSALTPKPFDWVEVENDLVQGTPPLTVTSPKGKWYWDDTSWQILSTQPVNWALSTQDKVEETLNLVAGNPTIREFTNSFTPTTDGFYVIEHSADSVNGTGILYATKTTGETTQVAVAAGVWNNLSDRIDATTTTKKYAVEFKSGTTYYFYTHSGGGSSQTNPSFSVYPVSDKNEFIAESEVQIQLGEWTESNAVEISNVFSENYPAVRVEGNTGNWSILQTAENVPAVNEERTIKIQWVIDATATHNSALRLGRSGFVSDLLFDVANGTAYNATGQGTRVKEIQNTVSGNVVTTIATFEGEATPYTDWSFYPDYGVSGGTGSNNAATGGIDIVSLDLNYSAGGVTPTKLPIYQANTSQDSTSINEGQYFNLNYLIPSATGVNVTTNENEASALLSASSSSPYELQINDSGIYALKVRLNSWEASDNYTGIWHLLKNGVKVDASYTNTANVAAEGFESTLDYVGPIEPSDKFSVTLFSDTATGSSISTQVTDSSIVIEKRASKEIITPETKLGEQLNSIESATELSIGQRYYADNLLAKTVTIDSAMPTLGVIRVEDFDNNTLANTVTVGTASDTFNTVVGPFIIDAGHGTYSIIKLSANTYRIHHD